MVDPLRRRAGRGVYAHASVDCLTTAARRGGFARGLKRRVAVQQPEALVRRVAGQLRADADQLAREALRDGRARSRGSGAKGSGGDAQLEPLSQRFEESWQALQHQVSRLGQLAGGRKLGNNGKTA